MDNLLPKAILVLLLFTLPANVGFSQKTARDLVDPLKNVTYLKNDWIKVGASLDLGGAITFLSDAKKLENIINNYDWGRQVQMSFYGGPTPYMPDGKEPHPDWKFLGWNPIQSGDWAGNNSRVVTYKNDGKQIYVKSIPMQWPLNNVSGECTFESWIKLNKNTVEVTSRITNNRKDKIQYSARSQELPAIYTNAPFTKLVTYSGTKPFQNDVLSDIENENIPAEKKITWANWQATENWAATLNQDNWGLGIYNAYAQDFIGGYYGKKGANGGSRDLATAYVSPLHKDILDHNITYTYKYVLILGSLAEIRAYAYAHHKPALPAYHFGKDRQHWHYKNLSDTGWPIKRNLEFTEIKEGAALISPHTIWQAELGHQLFMEAAYTGMASQANVYFKYLGENDFSENNRVSFHLIPGNKMRMYKIPLSKIAGYTGAISGLKIMPPVNGKNASLRIRSIKVQ